MYKKMYEIKETSDFLPLSKLFKRSGLEVEAAEKPAASTLKMWRIDHAETGELLAAATIELRNGCFVLGQLAVEKEVRKNGLGKRLLDLAEDELKKRGADKIWACAKVPSYYTQYGWEEVDRETAPNISHCQECEQFGRDCFPSIICKTINKN